MEIDQQTSTISVWNNGISGPGWVSGEKVSPLTENKGRKDKTKDMGNDGNWWENDGNWGENDGNWGGK